MYMYTHTHDCISIINVRSSITNITILFTIWHQNELMWVNKVCRGGPSEKVCVTLIMLVLVYVRHILISVIQTNTDLHVHICITGSFIITIEGCLRSTNIYTYNQGPKGRQIR